jgi:hypothetical protein
MLATLSNRRSGERRDFFFSTNRCCQILGESHQLAVARAAKFFSAVGRRRGKHVEAARANGFRENAKPLSIGNWIADGKIIAEIGVSSSPGSRAEGFSASAVCGVAEAVGPQSSPNLPQIA